MEDRTLLSTFLVSNTGDSGPGSLRQAIVDSNNAVGATNTIDFDIPGTGVQSIVPLSSLPAITNPVLIDGTSQPGYGGTPLIELSGSQAGGGDGLTITGSGVTVRGLDVGNFSQGAGIHITGSGATGNWIYGNFLGTDPTGTQAEPDDYGAEIDGGASHNLIGTNGDGIDDPAERNVISGNLFAGVWINGQGTDGNAVAGNLIGASVSGDVAVNNGTSPVYYNYQGYLGGGVVISGGASRNRIGTDGSSVDDAGERNVIAGSGNDGVDIADVGTEDNVVAGNFIGTNVTGTLALGIAGNGVFITGGASSNWIGVSPTVGAAVGDEGNVISGNGDDGVQIESSDSNIIAGNQIGTDVTGTFALVNTIGAVEVDSSAGNTIGGTTSRSGNLIVGSGPGPGNGFAVEIDGQGASGNVVAGNAMDTDITGTVVLGNAISAVQVNSGTNTVGGLTTLAGVFHGFSVAPGSSTADVVLQSDISGPPENQTNGTSTVVFHLDVETDGRLLAIGSPQGFTAQLMLLDSHGRVLVQSDGLAPTDPYSMIDQDLVTGSYSLVVENKGGAGTCTLTVSMTLSSDPLQPIPAVIGAGSLPPAMVAGDFTGDGDLSLAFAAPYEVSVLLGNGDGSFQPPNFYDTEDVSTCCLVAGDFTGDGHTDLAVVGSDYNGSQVSVLLGNGDGTFQPQVTYALPPSSFPTGIVAGDFAGDGRIDLAVVGQNVDSQIGNDGEVWVLLGNGDGTFQPAVTYALGLSVGAVAGGSPQMVAGDFTGDGRTDLAITCADTADNAGEVAVLLANSDGTFDPPVTYTVPEGAVGIVAGDFTGDGRLDLAVANGAFDNVSVLLGNGDGTFQSQATYPIPEIALAIVAGDFNGDGRTDLAVVGAGDTLSVLLANDEGTFEVSAPYALGYRAVAIVAGDFTGDGRVDLAMAFQSAGFSYDVSVWQGSGDGTFQSTVTNGAGGLPSSIATGDFTGNGRVDLAVADEYAPGAVSVLQGNGDGTFQPQVTYAVGPEPISIVAGDFNGDGRLDLAVSDADGIQILLGNGDGTFQAAKTVAAGIVGDLVAGDFTGNGKLDLAVADNSENDVSILLGNGDGTFQSPLNYPVGIGPVAIVVGDFSGGGNLDLAVTNFGSDNVSVLLGNGDGTFQPQVTYAVGTWPDAIATGDFIGNGRLDLAVANGGDNTVSVLLGNGDGTFSPQVTYAVGSFPAAIAAGDLSGNGRLDLAVANANDGTISVLLGNGDGTFQPQVTYAVGSLPESIVADDFTGDGRLDLATANLVSNTVSVLLARGDGTFADPSQFVTTPHATPLVADVNGDGTDDVLVVDGAGNILYRQGIPGQPGTFAPPITVNPENPSRDIAWVPVTAVGPLLASVDAQDDAVSLYAWRDGEFLRIGSLATGQLPAQIIAADLNGDGLDDLVVRNAGYGTLSIFSNLDFSQALVGPFAGPVRPGLQAFGSPVTLPVGLGVSDVQAVDTTGSGRLDLVVTNKLSGQVSVLLNLGNETSAPPVPYRAGTGLSEIDPGSTPEVTGLEATAGVAAGPLTPGGPTDLVTINPGSYTLDVLAGLGGGRFANPVTLQTASPAHVIRMGDFTGNGIDDLAVLTANGLSIYLGNGQGGFLPPTVYAVPPESDGLTVADLTGNGKLDLLVGDAYGDVLVLVGNGDGTFQPYHEANQAIELAVADLTGNGSKDIIYADQGLDRVVVDYGAGNSAVLANQSTGLLDPGAVQLAYLNGPNYPPDLIVANSGSNNVLIYPGLGNGQFGPAINGGHGYFVGTNPVGITVANVSHSKDDPRLDLVVADKGSNQVSILINDSHGNDISFEAGPRLNSGGKGPVSTVVGNFTGGAFPDILATNSQSNDVALLPGVGQGFFNDTNPTTFPVGANPVTSFVGNFNGQTDLLTVNAGSNDLTLISGFEGSNPTTSTIASGGVDPDTAFAFASSSGFEDLVVGNAGDGVLSLFEGVANGLTLMSTNVEPSLPSPTDLAFSALTGGQVQFYAATAGQEAASLVALSLGGETLAQSPPGTINNVAQLVPLNESSLALVGTLLTLTIASPGSEINLESAETGAGASVAAAASVSLGQGAYRQSGRDDAGSGDGDNVADVEAAAIPASSSASAWERFILGLDEALERFRREFQGRILRPDEPKAAPDPADSQPTDGSSSGDGPMSSGSTTNRMLGGSEPESIVSPHSSHVAETIDAIVDSIWCDEARVDVALPVGVAATMMGWTLLARPTVKLESPASKNPDKKNTRLAEDRRPRSLGKLAHEYGGPGCPM